MVLDRFHLVRYFLHLLFCLEDFVILSAFLSHGELFLALHELLYLHRESGILTLFFIDLGFDISALIFFLALFNLNLVVIDHHLGVLQDPVSDLRYVNLF